MKMRKPILLLASLGIACAFTQSWVGLNYLAGTGECEVDLYPRDGIVDGLYPYWAGRQGDSWTTEGIQLSLSSSRRFRGNFSQQISIRRDRDYEGRLGIVLSAISPNELPFITPPQGTPLLVRFRYYAENTSNLRAEAYVRTGGTLYPAGTLNLRSSGWQTLSLIVPLAHNTQGRPSLELLLEIVLGVGSSQGQIFIDAIEVLWTGYAQPQRSRPNPLKILHCNAQSTHHQVLLNPPADFIITTTREAFTLREYYPISSLSIYLDAPQTSEVIPTPWEDLFGGYEFVLQNHPHWFLRNSQGDIVRNPGYPYLYPLRIDLEEVRLKAIQSLDRINRELPTPEWLFFDNVGGWWLAEQFPSVLSHWTMYASQVFSHVRTNLNKKVIINAGAFAGAFLDGNPGTLWIQHVDAVMLEHLITFWGASRGYQYRDYRYNRATAFHTEHSWWATLRAVNAYPNKKWLLLCMSDYNNREMIRYILASYFVIMHDNTYLMIDARGSSERNKYLFWNRCPEAWVPLGRPTGSWRVQAGTDSDHTGALFARDFEYGIVLVNPTPDKEYTYTLPRAYKNWDGEVVPQGTTLTVRPRTGVALYAAPEIVLEITPRQITALPGEIVTFQVRCRNQGLQSGTNLQVSVPLPDGVEFISASDGGQYSNRQVRWNLPRLDAGQTRTLTFQARVQ